MAKIERSVDIHKSWQQVDAVALDGDRFSEWYAGVDHSEGDGTFPQVGGTAKLAYKAAGMTFDLTFTVLEYAPGKTILFQIAGGMLKGTSRWSHTPIDGGTRVTSVFDYETQGGGLGAIADRLVLERMNTSQMEKSLDSLKTLVEST